MNKITRYIFTGLMVLSLALNSFPGFVSAETDLRGVNFHMNGPFDMNNIKVGQYSEGWVRFEKDGKQINLSKNEVALKAVLTGSGQKLGVVDNARALENLVNRQPAGLYKISYSAKDLTGTRNVDFTMHFRSVELVGGGDGGGDPKSKPYKWDIGSWGSCKNGVETRVVICEDVNDNVLPDSACVQAGFGSKPATSRNCQDPVTYDWYTGPWGVCQNNSLQYRDVECRDDAGRKVNDNKCSGSKPSNSRTCDPQEDARVGTLSATDVDEDSAILRGRVIEGNGLEVWFVYSKYDVGVNDPLSCASGNRVTPYGLFDNGDMFTKYISGLDEDTTYYFRACGESQDGDRVQGSVESFRTDDNGHGGGDLNVICRISDTNVDDGDRITVEVDIDGGDSPYDIEWGGDTDEFDSFDDNDEEQTVRIDSNQDRIEISVTVRDDQGDYDSDTCPIIYVDEDDDNNDDAEIETRSATDIDDDSATLRGRIEEGDNVDVWFVLSRTDSTPSCSSGDKYHVSGNFDDGDSFDRTVSGLREDERYYFRACGESEDGDDISGRVEDFRTGDDRGEVDGDAPEAITYTPTNVQSRYAQLNGFYDSNGESTTVYFEWGRTAALGSTTLAQFKGTTRGAMIHGFTNLSPNTTYCYRAVATNSEGTDRGDIRCFTTLGGGIIINPPIGGTVDIDTLPDPELRGDEATLGGQVVRGNNIDTWFALDTDSSVSCRDTSDRTSFVGNYDSGDRFYDTVENLERGELYYFRACGSTSGGTIVSGELRDFVAGGDQFGYGYGLSFVRLEIENGRETLTRGESVEYTVEWENISEDDLFDLTLHITLPQDIVVTGASAGRFNRDENTVTYTISSLREGERGSMQVYGSVGGGFDEGEAVVAEAVLSFKNPINNSTENAIDYDDDTYSVYNPFGAAAFTLGTIGWWLWLLVLLLLIIIILAARWIYLEGKNRGTEKALDKNGNVMVAGGAAPRTEPIYEQPTSNYVPYRPAR